MQKIIISVLSFAALGAAGYFASDHLLNGGSSTNPEKITADYKDLLAEAEQLQVSVGADCNNKKEANKKIKALEDKLADLADRKKQWLDSVPPLPDVEPEVVNSENPLGRPGSEVPELSSDVPPLPDIDPDSIVITPGRPGSEVPELSSDVPPLPDVKIELIDGENDSEYIPEMPEIPEINTGRPGSEIPELSSDVPPLPEIDEMNIIDPDEYIFQMEEAEQKIRNTLQALKDLCQEEETPPKKISDKCSDACQRYKDCASYTEDVTPADLNDAYDTCMEECPTWPQEMVKCINAIDIKVPNDCVSFLQCRLPQLYEERYLK